MSHPTSTARLLATAAVLALSLASLPAAAAFVGSRAALAATGSLDWAQLGADGDSVADGSTASSSVAGLSVNVGNIDNPASLSRYDEAGSTWAGNFASGDALLTTFGDGGTLRLVFSGGISRIGTQIQGLDTGAFSGIIAAYNAGGTELERYSIDDADSDFTPDNSALFLGISRNTADIVRVEFSITGQTTSVFAINQLSLSQQVSTQPPTVPEPGALALAALALGGLAAQRRQQRQQRR